MEYWNEAKNYSIQTGDSSLFLSATDSSWKSQKEVVSNNPDAYRQKGWYVDALYNLEVVGDSFIENDGQGTYQVMVKVSSDAGEIRDDYGEIYQTISAITNNGQAQLYVVKFSGTSWKAMGSYGIQGVDYGEG